MGSSQLLINLDILDLGEEEAGVSLVLPGGWMPRRF